MGCRLGSGRTAFLKHVTAIALIMQNIVPGNFNSYVWSNGLVGLKLRLVQARHGDALLSTMKETV